MAMSLVERAAKRLQELGNARSSATADLLYPGSAEDAAQSLIERAVRRLESSPANQVVLEKRAARTESEQAANQTEEPRGNPGAQATADSFPGGTLTPKARAPEKQSHRQENIGRANRLELDLHGLASLGYVKPEESESEIANEFRRIKRPLIRACQGKLATPIKDANRILVTSSIPGEGKSFVSFNLALSIAMERDSTVLLIDADTTRRHLSQLVGIASKRGLLDLLTDPQMDVAEALFRTNIDRLSILPAGGRRRHATELLASEAMERLVEHLASRYPDRILIFDAPPLLGAPEPAVLASHMGQIIVVVAADSTTHKVLTNALATVRSCPVVTTILNKASNAEPSYFYGS
jgi:protein-tyrosine kinase